MPPPPDISVYSHQDAIPVPETLLGRLRGAALAACPRALEAAALPGSPLVRLEEVEVSLVDDATIADVHLRFMDIPGATDVITFDHGEIHVSVETARRQAREFGNGFERELMLYIIHGLLHLSGHEDASAAGQATMDRLQQEILAEVWQS